MSALHVVYPHGGRVFLLHWWTYDDRGHMIVSPTERGLIASARRIFTENPDAEIKGYSEVEIVAPGPKLHALAAQQVLNERVGAFFYEVSHRLREAAEAGRALPPPFERCTKFESDDEESTPDEWTIAQHSGCKHCKETIRLVGMTPGDLYARHHTRWLATHPDHPENRDRSREGKGRVESRARVARDDEHLWAVRANFGPHSKGLVLAEMCVDGEYTMFSGGSMGYSSLQDEALFFYLPIRDLDASELQAMLDMRKVEAKREQELREQSRKDEWERNKLEQINTIIAFFNEVP